MEEQRSGLGHALVGVTADMEVASIGSDSVVMLLHLLETVEIAFCLAFLRFYFLLGLFTSAF